MSYNLVTMINAEKLNYLNAQHANFFRTYRARKLTHKLSISWARVKITKVINVLNVF